jgi:type III secretion protein R
VSGTTVNLLLLVAAMAFLPLLAVAVTAFTKISVVLMILRNALGIQQLPPNIVVYSIAVILSAYVAAPMLQEMYGRVDKARINFSTASDYVEAATLAQGPLRAFLNKHVSERDAQFFVEATAKIWPEGTRAPVQRDDLAALVPAFLIGELTRAFQIGFLLYLPFLAVDIVVTAILSALGMMMVSPSNIAIPFKLLLFVTIEGWTKLLQGLILSYA